MGKLTRIYSCGDSMTTKQFLESCFETRGSDVDVWFPELNTHPSGDIPLREPEILAKLPALKGKTIVTVSETLILGFLREVRLGHMRGDDLELWCGDRRIWIDIHGDMIDMWDGGWEVGFNLRFH